MDRSRDYSQDVLIEITLESKTNILWNGMQYGIICKKKNSSIGNKLKCIPVKNTNKNH